MRGFIKFDRSHIGGLIWARPDFYIKIYIELLGMATITPRPFNYKGYNYQLGVGELVTSMNDVMERYNKAKRNKEDHISKKQVRTMFNFFTKHNFWAHVGAQGRAQKSTHIKFPQIVENVERNKQKNEKIEKAKGTGIGTTEVIHRARRGHAEGTIIKKGIIRVEEREENNSSFSENSNIPNQPIDELMAGGGAENYFFETVEDIPRDKPLIFEWSNGHYPIWLRPLACDLLLKFKDLTGKIFAPTTDVKNVISKCLQENSPNKMEAAMNNYWNKHKDAPKFQDHISPHLVWGDNVQKYANYKFKNTPKPASHKKFTIDD